MCQLVRDVTQRVGVLQLLCVWRQQAHVVNQLEHAELVLPQRCRCSRHLRSQLLHHCRRHPEVAQGALHGMQQLQRLQRSVVVHGRTEPPGSLCPACPDLQWAAHDSSSTHQVLSRELAACAHVDACRVWGGNSFSTEDLWLRLW